MSRILLVYATTDGHTRHICEVLAARMRTAADEVELLAVEQADTEALARADKIVLGASIRYGRHSAAAHAFVARHLRRLETTASAFFSVNLTARKPGKDRCDTNPYVGRFLARTGWQPRLAEVFAGRLDYPRYGWLDRQVIRFIMLLTHGPTDPRTVAEYTDWQRVAAFAAAIAALPDGTRTSKADTPVAETSN